MCRLRLRGVAGSGNLRDVSSYLERLAARTESVSSVLCLGLDPQPEALPDGFPATLAGVERFCEVLLDAAMPFAAAVKPNLAFFEAFGHEGIAALERLRGRVPADLPFIADAKRGDIGSTAARQAAAIFDILGADAVTVNPYLGSEAVEPLTSRLDRFAYLLCRTSNPGAGELQGLEVAPDPALGAPVEPLYARLARRAQAWGPGGTVGLVVGATAPAELERIRGIAPGLPFLVPGIGAQGGEVEPVLRFGPARALSLAAGTAATGSARSTAATLATVPTSPAASGGGLLVNVSRGISAAARTGGSPGTGHSRDVGERLADAAREWSSRLSLARLGVGES
jgi:orotidine-5'-phosphate decarboxylase